MAVAFIIQTACSEPSEFEPSEFEPDVQAASADKAQSAAVFNKNLLMHNAFFSDTSMHGPMIQYFLDNAPTIRRASWLAEEQINGQRASEFIEIIATKHRVNPMLLLARMQVENSLISESRRPSSRRIDEALGCGCHDGKACKGFSGLEQQLSCGAKHLREHFDASELGTGLWNAGRASRTYDPVTVTPVNSATAAHYVYTPWVLEGRGGNWLVWKVLDEFGSHARSIGLPIQHWPQ